MELLHQRVTGAAMELYAKAEAKKALRAALPSVFERREETKSENRVVNAEQRKKEHA